MTDDKENNIDRDNSIVNDNNKDKEIFFFSSCHERVTKKNFWVPAGNRTSDPRISRADTLPLSHRDSSVSEVCYKVVTQHW